jgi:hypothetical protein
MSSFALPVLVLAPEPIFPVFTAQQLVFEISSLPLQLQFATCFSNWN